MNNKINIPAWIYVCAAVVIISGCMGFYAGAFNPGLFFNFLPNMNWDADPLPFLNGLWGTRNLSMVLVMILGVVLRNPVIMFSIFLARTLTEIQDMFFLAPNTLDPDLMQAVANPTFFDQFMAVFPFLVIAAELAAVIGLARLLFRNREVSVAG